MATTSLYQRQEQQRANTARHLAARSADGKQTWTVVMEPCQVFQGEQLYTVRVENQHRYGCDQHMWHEANLPREKARSLANHYWTVLRERHGK